MSNNLIKVLLVEDNPDDVRLVREMLSESDISGFVLERADRISAGIERLSRKDIDVVLLDLSLPDSQGLDTLQKVVLAAPKVPIVVMNGLDDEELALQAVQRGAQDYIVKGYMDTHTLTRAIRYAIERKRSEEELHRVNRALKTLSDCNQALVRATDEPSLLHEICKILVVSGGYRTAWVGYAEQDEAKTVRQVACAGYEEGYLASLNITWADTDSGRGPTGTAIRTGEVCKANNILTNPSFTAWRSNALEPGYAASIALPLIGNGGPFGALNIYAQEADAFNEHDESLLRGLADNLAYGILALRAHAERALAIDRKRAEEALRESEERYRVLVENTPDFIYSLDREGRYTAVNQNVCQAMNLPFEAIIGKNYRELGFPEVIVQEWEGMHRRVLDGEVVEAETSTPMPDDKVRTHEVTLRPIKDSDGQITGIHGVSHDISERKRTEDALRTSEERFRILFEDSPISLWEEDFSGVKRYLEELQRQGVKDIKTFLENHPEHVTECVKQIKILDVNKATLRLYQAENKADILDHSEKILGANSYETIGDELVGILQGETKFEKEVVDQTLAGDKIMIRLGWTAAPGHEDALSKVIVSKIDITERKRAEQALLQSEERFREIFENMSSGVCVYEAVNGGKDFRITNFNRAAERIEKISRESVIGKTVSQVFPGVKEMGLLDIFQRVWQTGKPEHQPVTFYKDIREVGWRENYVAKLPSGEIVAIYDDITEHKQAEETLAGQTEDLHLRNEELERLYRASGSLLSSTPFDVQALARTIVEVVLKEFDQANCSVFLIRKHSNALDRLAVAGPYADQVRKIVLTMDGVGQVPQAIRSGQVINTLNVRGSMTYVPSWEAARAELTIPLKIGDQTIGAIDVQSPEPDAFNANDERLMSIFTERAALALEHARLFVQTEQRLQNLISLHKIDLAIASSFDLKITLGILLDQVTKRLDLHAADILVFNPVTQTFQYSTGQGFRTQALQHTNIWIGDGYAGMAVRERQTIIISNLKENLGGFKKSANLPYEDFTSYIGIPLIAKGQIKGVMEIFHREPLELDQEGKDFLEVLASQAAIAIDNAELFEKLEDSNAELMLAYDETIEGWSQAMDLRDKETEGHTRRVAEFSTRLARAMGMNENEMVHIRWGAMLHDIGKIGVPDDILRKPGPLTDEEWEIMRKHPKLAYDMLAPIIYLRPAIDIPYCHHEKWDGTGYPRGLKGDQIPSSARVFAVVDVWDALMSDRPYRKAWPREKTLDYILEQSGKHFDPNVVKVFLKEMIKDKYE